MDLTLKPEDEAFRAEVRGFLEAKLPREVAEAETVGTSIPKKLLQRWHGILHEQGWVAPGWPAEYGGTG